MSFEVTSNSCRCYSFSHFWNALISPIYLAWVDLEFAYLNLTESYHLLLDTSELFLDDNALLSSCRGREGLTLLLRAGSLLGGADIVRYCTLTVSSEFISNRL